jgi:hypothetical protein
MNTLVILAQAGIWLSENLIKGQFGDLSFYLLKKEPRDSRLRGNDSKKILPPQNFLVISRHTPCGVDPLFFVIPNNSGAA